MNPTQDTNNPAPEPRRDTDGSAAALAGLLSNGSRFRAHIASAMSTAVFPATVRDETAQPVPAYAPITVPGWCQQCGNVLPWVYTWDEPLCPDCVPATSVPAQQAKPQTFDVCGSCEAMFGVASAQPTCAVCATVAEVLRSAALYLERHGWIQGGYYDATEGVFTPPACLVGAIGMACYGGPVDAPAQHFDDPAFVDFEAAVLHLDRFLLVEDGSESYDFNDAKGRALADVTRVLRKAAATPEHELLDALRAIDEMNEQLAASGVTTEQVLRLISGEAAPTQHDGKQHPWGTKAGCSACEAWCFCHLFSDGSACVRCASDAGTTCLFCGAPGGYPYCRTSYSGGPSCADVVAAEDAETAAQDGDDR